MSLMRTVLLMTEAFVVLAVLNHWQPPKKHEVKIVVSLKEMDDLKMILGLPGSF
jgi:hypothetical protein